jgi:hypothetical protein
MATAIPQTTPTPARHRSVQDPQLIIYSHSNLLYWWPVWVIGYIMALLTWMKPVSAEVGPVTALFSPQADLGVIFALLVVLVILLTNTKMRGVVSAVVAVSVAFVVLLFAHLNWWTTILAWFGSQAVYMNLGFYLFFSTALLIVWLVVVLGVDHLSFWRVRPGQITHEYFLGAVDRSFDTDNMIFTKQQSDVFRHWILGFGAGDLRVQTMGGLGREIAVENVLFVSAKVAELQRLIATKPDVPTRA